MKHSLVHMPGRWGAVALAAVAGVVVSATPAAADVWSYEADDGTVVYTNVPTRRAARLVYKSVGGIERATIPLASKGGGKHRGNVTPKQRASDVLEYWPHIIEAGKRFSIPHSLLCAVIAVESDFDPDAVSHAGAQGLMQLMPGTAADMGVRDAFNPRDNIFGGTRYLRQLANKFNGDVVLMLAAYNAGHSRVEKTRKVPQIAETRAYVRKVLGLYRVYSEKPPVTTADAPLSPSPFPRKEKGA